MALEWGLTVAYPSTVRSLRDVEEKADNQWGGG